MKNFYIEEKVADSVILNNEKVIIQLLLAGSINISLASVHTKVLNNLQGEAFKLFDECEVLNSLIRMQADKSLNLCNHIIDKFLKDIYTLKQQKIVSTDSLVFFDIDFNVGDFHNGRCTSIITVDSNNLLVFKPTDGRITIAFNNLLDWINNHYYLGNYKFKVLNRDSYHWLEFVKQEPISKEQQLHEYYERAGYITCITYLLNSSDYHFENVICNGDLPVLIDHETIVQPHKSKQIQSLFKTFDDESLSDTILDSKLLPNTLCKVNMGLSIGVCGFGWHIEQSIMGVETVGINRFTKDWKMVTKFIKQNLFKHNVPEYNKRRVYLTEYVEDFIEGFESCYKLLISKKNFLFDDEVSPLKLFENCKIRYIWRSTDVYAKILKKIKSPKYLVSLECYEQKIHDYLAVAFKNVPKDSDLMFIHKHEVAQMLRGDIPFFEVNSSSRNLETEFGTIKDFFNLSAVENIQRKLKKLSFEDLENQKDLIKKTLSS